MFISIEKENILLYSICFDLFWFFFVSSVGLLSSWKCFLYFGIVCASASIQHASQSHTGTQIFEIEIWFGICHRTVCLSHSHTGVNPYRCCRFFWPWKGSTGVLSSSLGAHAATSRDIMERTIVVPLVRWSICKLHTLMTYRWCSTVPLHLSLVVSKVRECLCAGDMFVHLGYSYAHTNYTLTV